MQMITKEEFFSLPTREVQQIVARTGCPVTGIFLTDGNRRLVGALTGNTPGTHGERFYDVYKEMVTSYFMKNLEVFFGHGLQRLFLPLFGPALLEREDMYRQSVIPGLVDILFKSEDWKQFYRTHRIRVKSYGDLDRLDREFPGLNQAACVRDIEAFTASHEKHTLYFGFFSTPWLPVDFMVKIGRLSESEGRELGQREMIELYYGESIPPADFFINSTRIAGLGALPPLLTGKDTRIYTTVAPGIYALTRDAYRSILYDMLFCRSCDNPDGKAADGTENEPEEIDRLKDYYSQHRDTVFGGGKRIGRYWVLEAHGK